MKWFSKNFADEETYVIEHTRAEFAARFIKKAERRQQQGRDGDCSTILGGLHSTWWKDGEVIGNIYENPELIK